MNSTMDINLFITNTHNQDLKASQTWREKSFKEEGNCRKKGTSYDFLQILGSHTSDALTPFVPTHCQCPTIFWSSYIQLQLGYTDDQAMNGASGLSIIKI